MNAPYAGPAAVGRVGEGTMRGMHGNGPERQDDLRERAARAAPKARWACTREALEALSVMVAFVGFALAWASIEGRAADARASYPDDPMAETSGESERGAAPAAAPKAPHTWLVDGFNVLNVGLLRGAEREAWWGPRARARLIELACRFDDPHARLWLVFDGTRPADPDVPREDGRVHVRFEPSADDWLLARVRSAADPRGLALVTADRKLADRARHRGAAIVPPHAFLTRCNPPASEARSASEARTASEARSEAKPSEVSRRRRGGKPTKPSEVSRRRRGGKPAKPSEVPRP